MIKYGMHKILNLYKPVGITPNQLIQKLRIEYPELKDIKIGFAGRLDPLAHGVMLLMLGDATKERNKYLGLSKEYEFEILFGVNTDTYDALGILEKYKVRVFPEDLKKQIKKYIKSKIGTHMQAYPPYSSKEVHGKPLYQWARENKLSEINIPTREIVIYNFELLSIRDVPSAAIKKRIVENIQKVDGDFRQLEILEKWHNLFEKNDIPSFRIARCKINCSTGTYVRSLVHEIGDQMITGAIAIEIVRTRVGEYVLQDSATLNSV